MSGGSLMRSTSPPSKNRRNIVTKVLILLMRGGFSALVRKFVFQIQLTPKLIVFYFFNFNRWHVNSYSHRPYTEVVVSLLNNREIKSSAVEIGCGLGDILRRLHFGCRVGLDNEQEVLNAAIFISRFHNILGRKIEFRKFDVLNDELVGRFDAILMVNWIHNIEPLELKRIVERMFSENLNMNGVLVFDVLSNKGYKYNHSFEDITENLLSQVTVLGPFDFGRSIVFVNKTQDSQRQSL